MSVKNPEAKEKNTAKSNGQVSKKDKSTSILSKLSDGLRQMIPDSLNYAQKKEEKKPKHKNRVTKEDSEHIVMARRVLRGERWTVENLKHLYKALMAENQFNYARKILQRLREHYKLHKDIHLCQEHAMCTYKDESLPADVRYDLAIEVLKSRFELNTTTNLRTLGLMGSIYKGKWSYDNQNDNLERALMYYNAGKERWLKLREQNKKGDNGYCAINAAFVLDLLASNKLAAKFFNEHESLQGFSKKAQEIRYQIIDYLKDEIGRDDTAIYWINVTIAEAHFGLYQYEEAKPYLKTAKDIADKMGFLWEFESTAQQLASLAEVQLRIFKDHEKYELKRDEQAQSKIEELLITSKLIPQAAAIASSVELAYFILKIACPLDSGLGITRDHNNDEEYFSNLEELVMMCLDYYEADAWIAAKFQKDKAIVQLGKELKIISLLVKKRITGDRLNTPARQIMNLFNPDSESSEGKQCLITAIKTLRDYPEAISDFKVFSIHSAAENITNTLDQNNKTLSEKNIQLIFKLSIKALKLIHKYGYAEYAKMVLAEIPKDEPNIDKLKNSKILDLTPFGVLLFNHRDQELYVNFIKEVNYTLADNKLSSSEKKTLRLHTKKVLTAVAKEQLEDQAREALHCFTQDNSAVDTAFKGKVGLALSGGGFRASLYHIGVLARMAELDILRHVEVISCVSGGSIIGAYYYLALKNLLESNTDKEITREDYIRLVKDVEKGFLKAVQKNIRMRVLDDWLYNIKMFFSPKATRSARLAKLYEKYFYRDLFYANKKGVKKKRIPMRSLVISPKTEGEKNTGNQKKFNIHLDNWQRDNKVPELILNATSLNTGHNWQFTATWMGEPSGSIVSEVDAKYRLRRMYYYEAPKEYRDISLGEAVAASSGVPGLFEPLELDDLYPNLKVQLVDGGVHDNQGVVGLLERECKIFFVSDASGQVLSQDVGASGMLPVILRTNEVLQGRIRESQYLTLKSRNESALMKAMMFVHLRKDLSEAPKNWKYCQDPSEYNKSALSRDKQADLTKYGIRTEIQKRLASIRTDLDSFNDAEAFALMYSGYKMTELEHRTTTQQYFTEEFQRELGWKFLQIKDYVHNVEKSKHLEKILDVSSKVPFKIFYLSKLWQYVGLTLLAIASVGVIYLLIQYWETGFTIGQLAILFFISMLPVVLGKIVDYASDLKGSLQSIVQKIGVAFFGAAISKLFLVYFNRRYNTLGSLPIQNRDYLANLYLGFLTLVIGIGLIGFNWISDFETIVSNFITENFENIKEVELQMTSITQYVESASHYFSYGLMAFGIAVLIYFRWKLKRKEQPA